MRAHAMLQCEVYALLGGDSINRIQWFPSLPESFCRLLRSAAANIAWAICSGVSANFGIGLTRRSRRMPGFRLPLPIP